MGSANCTPRNVEQMTIGTQTEDLAQVVIPKSPQSHSPHDHDHHLGEMTILGRKKATYDAEPRLTYNSNFDLLMDPRCLVPWSDDYSVGIELIDSHHKILVRLINDLNETLKEGHMRFEIGSVIDNLVEYTEFHFGMEEIIMEKYKYKPLSMTKHKETHRNFVKKIFDVREDFRTMKTENIGQETLDFLRDWLLKHILHSDKKMCQFFLEQMKREEAGLPLLGASQSPKHNSKEKAVDSEFLESSVVSHE